jgi:outer membrane protein assembly factor BamB
VDAGTGARRWTAYLGTGSDPMSSIDGSPAAVADGIVWTESSLHTLNALDSVTGEILWIYRYQPRPIPYYRSGWQDRMTLPNEPISLIAPAGERLLFAPRWGDQCVALDGRTGKVLWSAPRGDARSLFAVDEARAYLCGNEVHALDLATGARRWSWTAPDARAGYAALAGDRVYVPVGPTVYVLDRATGRQVAQLDLGSHQVEAEFGAALLAGSRFLLSQPERLFALEAPMRQTLLSRQPSVIGRERED